MAHKQGGSGPVGPIRLGGEISPISRQLKEQAAQLLDGSDISLCYQCGVCTGSCATANKMAYGPRKIIRMLHLGLGEQVLSSPDIWYCVSCYSCSARCPQGVPISDVMSLLRNMSVSQRVTRDKEATFSRIFLKVLQEHGRMYEPEVLMRYYASVLDIDSMIQIVPLGIGMFLKGKIGLLPERIRNARELAEISAKVSGGKVT